VVAAKIKSMHGFCFISGSQVRRKCRSVRHELLTHELDFFGYEKTEHGEDRHIRRRQRCTRPTTCGNKTQGLPGVMTVRPSARAGPGQSRASVRDRQRRRVEATDGRTQARELCI
jgi:hypothetical protein